MGHEGTRAEKVNAYNVLMGGFLLWSVCNGIFNVGAALQRGVYRGNESRSCVGSFTLTGRIYHVIRHGQTEAVEMSSFSNFSFDLTHLSVLILAIDQLNAQIFVL